MMVETVLSRSIRVICAGGMALGMSSVYAQEAAAPAAPMQKVEVTGSRIPTLNVDGTSPVVVLGAKEIKTDGVRNVESLLNNLPQVVAAQTATVSNGSSGTASVNLRGLGANRTLVLVDGKRLPSGSPNSSAADLNQIPAGLIKRIEVLTGGAGAVYGADAVAGVVNFIMNDRFEGVQIETNISGFSHNQQNPQGVGTIIANRAKTNPKEFKLPGDDDWGGQSREANLLIGGNFDGGKGNAVAYFSYKEDETMTQAERDFTACALGASAAGFSCGGSGTAANGTFFTDVGAFSATPTGVPRPYVASTDAYNFGPTNFLQRPSERYGFAAKVRYDVMENTRLYGDFSMHDDRTDAQVAPGGIFFETLSASWDNPLLTPEWKTALGLTGPGDTAEFQLGRRNVEGGGRKQTFQNTSFRTLIGAKGELGGVWNWDVFFQTARVRGASSNQNYFSIQRIQQAFDVVNKNGVAVCRDASGGCVPYNAWKTGAVTKEMLDFIQIPGQAQGYTSQQIQGATIAADLGNYGIKFPWVSSGVGFSAGVERRVEALVFDPDGPSRAGDLSGTGGPATPVSGRYVVKDIFTEARSVIAENMVGAKKLELNASFRHTEIDTGVSANTYGVGVDWQPVDPVRVRYSHQKAVRAPNIFELFSPAGLGLYDMDEDPCAGATPTATAAACARTGVTAAQYGKIIDSPAGQYNALFGGNPKLNPEEAESNTFGFVINPMRNLTLTVDYFDIKIENAISTVGPTTVLDKCLATGDAVFCNKITRSPNGSLWLNGSQIVATQVNIGGTRTSGIDFGAAYTLKLNGMGSIGFNFNGSLLKKLEIEELPGEKYDCVGYYNGAGSCGQSNPEWRHKMRVNWNTPWGIDVAATWRHIAEVEIELASSNPLLKGNVHEVDRYLGERNYLDLAAAYTFNKHFSLVGGINNVLDRDPPLSAKVGAGLGNGNTFPGMYDSMGRKMFLNLTARF